MNTGKYTCLELFAKQTAPGGRVRVLSDTRESQEKAAGSSYYVWLKFSLCPDTEYEIVCDSCDISLCYLSGCENILETGVCYLERTQDGQKFTVQDPAAWYDRPVREAYHFAPWKNWMNDPNGLCWFQGYYHMFYQCNPHGQEWSNMYWGHAASRDLVHWTHLPIVLAPQEDILMNPNTVKGGAFSGCAVVDGDEVIFYLTRHQGPLQDCESTVEQQWIMRSRDMIRFTEEKCVIESPPEEASFDFRDPKVLKIGETWYMVLGSAIKGKGAILLYESEDKEHWKYVHPLLLEEQYKIRCFECPDLMELDGRYLAVGAFMEHYDSCGRYQMSRYYIGNWRDRKFEKVKEGWFDFGSNCYAMQSFVHQGRRISIGWVSDFYGEHVNYPDGVYGSMTIPRQLHIRNDRLYMTPVEEVLSLRGEILYQGGGENIIMPKIEGNAYRAVIKFSENTFFTILLGQDEDRSISLLHDLKGLRIVTKGVRSEGIDFAADVAEVRELEIYMDRRVAEVYVNGGEAVGTKVFYNTSQDGCFELCAMRAGNVERAELALMKSIWNPG